MPIEIERKFLVRDSSWRSATSQQQHLIQVYFATGEAPSVRLRITDSQTATLTTKFLRSQISRFEFEQEIDPAEAQSLLHMAHGNRIEKTRHTIENAGQIWVIDEYHGDNEGLVVAEIELSEENENFEFPDWLGDEITGVQQYKNSMLSHRPYCHWQAQSEFKESA